VGKALSRVWSTVVGKGKKERKRGRAGGTRAGDGPRFFINRTQSELGQGGSQGGSGTAAVVAAASGRGRRRGHDKVAER